jgi:hypothetical protein
MANVSSTENNGQRNLMSMAQWRIYQWHQCWQHRHQCQLAISLKYRLEAQWWRRGWRKLMAWRLMYPASA